MQCRSIQRYRCTRTSQRELGMGADRAKDASGNGGVKATSLTKHWRTPLLRSGGDVFVLQSDGNVGGRVVRTHPRAPPHAGETCSGHLKRTSWVRDLFIPNTFATHNIKPCTNHQARYVFAGDRLLSSTLGAYAGRHS